jgi:hypothetical protein
MKKYKILFWVTTGIIFLTQGVLTVLTSQTEQAKEGLRHLGYPDHFGKLLVIFKVLGALALIIPRVPKRVKEWAYAGFAFDFISAFVSLLAVDGPVGGSFAPVIAIAFLAGSYFSYHKLQGD